uniref:Uncharacterized protein n=1 Tax=Oryza rufipogon TaxID=4529 RepID=A0A0E0PB39_ORYRU
MGLMWVSQRSTVSFGRILRQFLRPYAHEQKLHTTKMGASSSRQVQSRHGRGGAGGARPEERCYAYARKIRLLARVRVTTKGKGKWEVVEPITRRREAHETNAAAAAAAVQGCVWWLRSNATRGWVGERMKNVTHKQAAHKQNHSQMHQQIRCKHFSTKPNDREHVKQNMSTKIFTANFPSRN